MNASGKNNEDEFFSHSSMSLGEHLDELRSRLIKSLIGLAVALVVCLIFGNSILGFVTQPLLLALKASGNEDRLYVSSVPEALITYIKVSAYAAIFIASPWIFYQLWQFIAAGLYPRERRHIHLFVPVSSILFAMGGAFFIWIVAPLSFNFFITIGNKMEVPQISDNILTQTLYKAMQKGLDPTENTDQPKTEEPNTKKPLVKTIFTLQKYVSLVMTLSIVFSLAFQMPLIVLFLGKMSLVKLKTLCSTRKYVFFGIVCCSAMMTPPDVISQIALSVPMYLLYELGIIMLRIWPPQTAS